MKTYEAVKATNELKSIIYKHNLYEYIGEEALEEISQKIDSIRHGLLEEQEQQDVGEIRKELIDIRNEILEHIALKKVDVLGIKFQVNLIDSIIHNLSHPTTEKSKVVEPVSNTNKMNITHFTENDNEMSAERIPTVIIEFKSGIPSFIMEKKYYYENGGGNLMKFCSGHSINPKEVHRVLTVLMDAKDYPTEVWEG